MSKSKAKGTAAETAIVEYLAKLGVLAVRNPPQGTKDKGDINILGVPIAVEVKNCRTMKLAEWVDESIVERAHANADIGVVWHKRSRKGSPGDWYVTMTGLDFINLLSPHLPFK
jgi:Holliday junction resolvase